jgi:hypothetical protein
MLLQVVMMPSPGDEIAKIFSQLGQALPSIFNREGIERQRIMDQIAANPTYGQQLAGQVRAATAEGSLDANKPGLAAVGQQLGLDMGNPESQAFLASLSMTFPATLEEQTGALATGAPVGLTASPTAQLQHEATTKGLEADVQRSTTEIITGLNEQERQEVLNDLNYPQLLATYDIATARLGIEDTKQKMEAWKQLDKFIKANPELAGQEAAGLVNPAFLDYLSLLGRLSLEERLAMAKKDTTPAEALALLMSLTKDREEIENNFTAALAAAENDEDRAGIIARQNTFEAMGSQVAAIAGVEWPETPRTPDGQTVVYEVPRLFTDRVNSLEDARLEARAVSQYEFAVSHVGRNLLHLKPGTLEFGTEMGRLMGEVMQSDLGPYLDSRQLVGEFRNEIVAFVRDQLNIKDKPTGEAETPPTPEEIDQAMKAVEQGQAATVGQALDAIRQGVLKFVGGIIEQSRTTTPSSPTGRQ